MVKAAEHSCIYTVSNSAGQYLPGKTPKKVTLVCLPSHIPTLHLDLRHSFGAIYHYDREKSYMIVLKVSLKKKNKGRPLLSEKLCRCSHVSGKYWHKSVVLRTTLPPYASVQALMRLVHVSICAHTGLITVVGGAVVYSAPVTQTQCSGLRCPGLSTPILFHSRCPTDQKKKVSGVSKVEVSHEIMVNNKKLASV